MFNTGRMVLNLKAKMGVRTTIALADALKIPASTINYMDKTNNPTIRTLTIIATAAGIELDALVKMGVVDDK